MNAVYPPGGTFTVSGSSSFFPNLPEALAATRAVPGPVMVYHHTDEVLTREHGEVTSHRTHTRTVAALAGRSP